jgi:hypothetical protein
MVFRDFFLARPQREEPEGLAFAASTEASPPVGVFITPQSLVTFPGASLAVTVVLVLLKKLVPGISTSPWVTLVAALVVGTVIFIITISDADAAPKTRMKWLVAVAIALFNSLYLAASILGLLHP